MQNALLSGAKLQEGEDRAQAYLYAGIAQQKIGYWPQARTSLLLARKSTRDPGVVQRIDQQLAVTLEKPLDEDYVRAFADGMWFEHEGIRTRPAQLQIVSDHVAEVSLMEGRYHQIKRMFGRFRNRVLTLHRFAVGNLLLDAGLESGASRALTDTEALAVNPAYRSG